MIILASTSATRQAMMRNAGLSITAAAPQVDEPALIAANPLWLPRETALNLAEAKAVDVSRRNPQALVIGADQVLALGDRAYSKPRDRAHCRQQLMELRGKEHQLISGVALAQDGVTLWLYAEEANLIMRNFSEAFLDRYLDIVGDDCMTSVGGYKIEGLGVQLFQKITGDYFTILGVPLLALLARLRQSGELSS